MAHNGINGEKRVAEHRKENMSNLSLPRLDYAGLLEGGYSSTPKRVAYETAISRDGDRFTLFHHGTPIAMIGPRSVAITNAGWQSRTTCHRLNAVTTANGVGWVYIHEGRMLFTSDRKIVHGGRAARRTGVPVPTRKW